MLNDISMVLTVCMDFIICSIHVPLVQFKGCTCRLLYSVQEFVIYTVS